jgi:hypothetical protein
VRSAELYAPAGFTRHVVAPVDGAYCPNGQDTQLPLARYAPAAHWMQLVKSALLYAPGAHAVHATALAADTEPCAHAWQLQLAFRNVPAEQLV